MKSLAFALVLVAAGASAEIPGSYAPVVLRPSPDTAAERVFDLTPAFERARRQNRPLLIYVGAADCPPCQVFTRFLTEREREMRPVLDRVVLVDVRTTVRGPRPTFLLDGQKFSTLEFKRLIGNFDAGLAYPTWWLVNAEGRQIRPLPRGVEHHLDVGRYREWLAGFEEQQGKRGRERQEGAPGLGSTSGNSR